MKRFILLSILAIVGLLNIGAKEMYAVYNFSSKTLTFYYDDLKNKRNDVDNTVRRFYSSDWENIEITKAVFDKSFDDARPKSLNSFFAFLYKLESIKGIQYLHTENVTDMSDMFFSCESLTSLDLSSINTRNVTDMHGMFYECSSLTSLDLSGFNTEKVTEMWNMFRYCNSLISLDLSSFNTGNVTDMRFMFYECSSLTSLDLSSFNTKKVTSMNRMFYRCSNLETIYVGSNWSMDNVTDSENMFSGSENLVGGAGTAYNDSRIDGEYARMDGGASAPGYFSTNLPTKEEKTIYIRIAYNSSEYNCWGKYLPNHVASDVLNLKIDGKPAEPRFKGSYLIVSDDLKVTPLKVSCLLKTANGFQPYIWNYDVVDYGISINGTKLTSLNMNDIPGLKSGKAYLDDNTAQGGSLGWDKTPTLVLEDATIELTKTSTGIEFNAGYSSLEGLKIQAIGSNSIINYNSPMAVRLDVGTTTTIVGGGTLRIVNLNYNYSWGYAIETWVVSNLRIKEGSTLIVDAYNGYAIYDQDGMVLDIDSGSKLCLHSVNGRVISLDTGAKYNFGSGIALRYPVGAYMNRGNAYYADGTEVKGDWLVFGPEGAVPPSESIAVGIESLTPTLSKGEGAIYNLSGQRLNKPAKGINIVDGKKVLVK